MAIGLSDLNTKKEIKKKEVIIEEIITSEVENSIPNDKQQRPWEGITQSQKSTVASLALKKAKEVTQKNDEYAKSLRENFIDPQKELELKQYIDNREREFQTMHDTKHAIKTKKRIKTHRSFLKRLRLSLFGS